MLEACLYGVFFFLYDYPYITAIMRVESILNYVSRFFVRVEIVARTRLWRERSLE